jgi:hypothetical protein
MQEYALMGVVFVVIAAFITAAVLMGRRGPKPACSLATPENCLASDFNNLCNRYVGRGNAECDSACDVIHANYLDEDSAPHTQRDFAAYSYCIYGAYSDESACVDDFDGIECGREAAAYCANPKHSADCTSTCLEHRKSPTKFCGTAACVNTDPENGLLCSACYLGPGPDTPECYNSCVAYEYYCKDTKNPLCCQNEALANSYYCQNTPRTCVGWEGWQPRK